MRDDGYTIAEMLVALAIIGLAFGGFVEATRTLAGFQRAAVGATAQVSARTAIARTLSFAVADDGPFFSNQTAFVGTTARFAFACSAGACGASITPDGARSVLVAWRGRRRSTPVSLPQAAAFRYADGGDEGDAWPQAPLPPERLRAIFILADGARGEPLGTVRLAVDEPPDCVFDPIAQACRLSQ
jgi:prepilin-type N-terminal cleavage/methylation domain-containing protein